MHRRRLLAIVCAASALLLATVASASVPDDPLAAHPAYATLNLPEAWEITTGSPNVVIAVIDSGVDPSHPELAGAVDAGFDFVADRPGAAPVDGHGTGVAGAAAARANNGLGGVGACFECRILPLQVVGANGIALNVHIAEAIDYAVDHGAAVVNISLIGPNSPPELARAITRARAAGVLVVAAAGNDASVAPHYPAATPGAISVGAVTSDGVLASFSNRGTWVKFAAPECAPIAVLGGGSGVGCGTSMSSPLVAGIVALMRAQAPYATVGAIETSLVRTSRFVRDTRYGLPDAAAALRDLATPAARLSPTVHGLAAVGRQLEAFSGLWVGSGVDVEYRWERCSTACTPIAGASSRTYTPVAADGGRSLRVVATAGSIGTTASPRTRVVEAAPRVLRFPEIVGAPSIGARLTATLGAWRGTNLRFSVVWLRCKQPCERVATGRSYRVKAADRGHRLVAEVVASNSAAARTARSRPTRIVR